MPSFTVRIAIDTEAPDAQEAIGNVKYLLAEQRGPEIDYRFDLVTDEDGEEVDPYDDEDDRIGARIEI